MHKKRELNIKIASSKAKRKKLLKKETEKGSHGLINSLYKWGEDYYGAEDYYEKPVTSIPNSNDYNDFQKKADTQ